MGCAERRMTLPVDPTEPYPDLEVCSRCRESVTFEYDSVDGWVSVCCWAPAVEVEAPAWMED